MAQRNPIAPDDVSGAEAARKELERLATEQGVQPIVNFALLRAEFWPEDESVDDFVRNLRERRRTSEIRSVE